jgi:uncharacterized protein YkwD
VIGIVRRAAIVAALLAVPLTGASVFAAATPASAAVAKSAKSVKAKKKVKKSKKKKTAAAAPAQASVTATTAPSTLETQVITLVNTKRTAAGCKALRTDSRLITAARAHSTDMVTNNFFSHTGSDGSTFVIRANRAGYTAASAENIAWGWATADKVVTEWMNSAPHRANILNCSSVAVGVGLVKKADGTPYWTQVFGRA